MLLQLVARAREGKRVGGIRAAEDLGAVLAGHDRPATAGSGGLDEVVVEPPGRGQAGLTARFAQGPGPFPAAGSVLGTAFILLLPQVMQAAASSLADVFPAMQQGVAYIKEMSIGAAIILFLIFEPEGLIHRWRLIRASLKLYPFSY